MKLAIVSALALIALLFTESGRGDQISRQIRHGVEIGNGLRTLAIHTDTALKQMIDISVRVLIKRGHWEAAEAISGQYYSEFDGYLERNMQRGIGDHKPLSKFLADAYDKIESILGPEACKALHLSDLKTINFCIPVVFAPCNKEWNGFEYRNHFAGDGKYSGLLPVITFWAIFAPCEIATFGVGTSLFCGPVGSAAEWLSEKYVAPDLSDYVYLYFQFNVCQP